MENSNFTQEQLIVPRNLEELMKELRIVFSNDRVNVEHVQSLLESYTSNQSDWMKYAKFDPHRYIRHLIDEGNGKYNLMVLCWGERQGSKIHDHNDADCFVKVLSGELMETKYAWPKKSEGNGQMLRIDCNVYGTDQVTYMCDEIGLHRMENPSHTEGTVTMHLYSPPFMECQMFDERTGHTNVAKMTFWSKYSEPTALNSRKISCAQMSKPVPAIST